MTNLNELLELVRQDDERVAREQAAKDDKAIAVAWLCARHPLLGGEYYRGLRPAALASRQFNWHTACCSWMGTPENQERGPLHLVTMNNHVIRPDVIVVRPVREWSEQWTEQAHANGQKVIADIDDDVWAHEDWAEGKRPNDDHFDDWFWKVDAVLTSTAHLARRLREMKHPAPIYVAPNCYDPVGLANEPHPGRTMGTRMWLSGRMSGDLELYRDLFIPLLEELDLGWVHVGYEERTGAIGEGQHGVYSFAQLGCPSERLLELPSAVIPEMGKVLAQHISLGAIAMADQPYNKAKTETHAMELASIGLPLISASDHPLYQKIPGTVAPTPSAVRARVIALLDPETWHIEARRSKAWAKDRAVKCEAAYLESLSRAVAKVALN